MFSKYANIMVNVFEYGLIRKGFSMTELFDAIYVDPKDSNSNKRGLINALGDAAADYCFDKAELKEEHAKAYKKCMTSKDDMQNIAIACMAIQQGLSYGTDAGDVQKSVYKMLFDYKLEDDHCVERDERGCYKTHPRDGSLRFRCDSPDDCIYSKDRMTNFGYIFRIAIHALESISDGLDSNHVYNDNTNNGTKSNCTKNELLSKGLRLYESAQKKAFRHGASLENLYCLNYQMNKLARLSATLGNYCCVPKHLDAVGEYRNDGNVNCAKSGSLYLNRDPRMYVNDQFALFLEWLGDAKLTRSERSMVKQWKEAMLIECCEGYYLQAAWHYKEAASTKDYKYCLEQLTKYLRCVNAAIEIRGKQIVKTIKDMKESESMQTKKHPLL